MSKNGYDTVEELRAAWDASRIEVISEPLTYRRDARTSYFRDFLLRDRIPGAQERLERHGREMRDLQERRDKAARRRLEDTGFELRAESSRTDGEGGYFSPPTWLNEHFATGKHPARTLANLIKAAGGAFPLPAGVSQINVPIINGSGTTVAPGADNAAVPDGGFADSAGQCYVVTCEGMTDVALQMLEQSPPGAHMDWVIYKDLKESYDANLELQLIAGTGPTTSGGLDNQILGVTNVASIVSVSYTDASPTGAEFWPFLGQMAAQLADGRRLPPECWLWRTARWMWLGASEDTATLPFGLLSPFYLGRTDNSPDPLGGALGLPVFPDEAIPATLGAGGNQDELICLRPSDLLLFEGDFQTIIARDPLSGTLGARIAMHNYAAAVTNRYPSGIAVLTGTGMAVASGY